MTYRYIYKITCTAGNFKGKFYYGQHTTNNLDDNYKGSGKLINDYYQKYPNDYIKEIVSFHNTKEELNQAEYDIIQPWLGNSMCLNLTDGGHINTGYHHKEESRKKMSESHKGHTPWNKGQTGVYSEEILQKMSESRKGKGTGKRTYLSDETRQKLATFKGKKHTQETKNKIRESLKGKHLSEECKNKLSKIFSNTVWINKDNITTRVTESNLQNYLDDGWNLGRKINKKTQ